MHYIGIDIIEIARIKKAIARWGESFLYRVYTGPELKLYHKKPLSLAARFADGLDAYAGVGSDLPPIGF